MTTLSVVITTHNNQDLIADCLKSIKFADEIILVDNQSSDDTISIAKKFKVSIFHHQNQPKVLNRAKNYGFNKATSDWILSLDSDERIESVLASEIEEIMKQDFDKLPAGFAIPRKNIIFGKWIKHGLWYPDYQIRLFKKDQGKFPEIHNHELLKVKSNTGELKGHILHINYRTVSQYIQKIDRQYSDNEVDTFLDGGHKIHWYDALRFPFQDFLTNFFVREAYKDGLHGLVLSLLQAFYMFIVFCKIWEREEFKPSEVTLDQTESELKRLYSQFKYWFINAKYKTASPLSKIILKLQSIL